MTAAARDLRPTVVADPAGPLRKAALLLHTMSEADRSWLLSRLTDSEQRALRALLGELRQLGMPADRGLLDEALGRDARTAPKPAVPAVREAVRAADPARLALVLRDEPPLLVARLLRVEDWPWRRPLLQALPAPARRRVEEAMQGLGGPRGDLLEAHLLAALARRLADAPRTARGPAGWLRRLGLGA